MLPKYCLDIRYIYFESLLHFYVLLNIFASNPFLRFVRFESLEDIIKLHFTLIRAKFNLCVDFTVNFFV